MAYTPGTRQVPINVTGTTTSASGAVTVGSSGSLVLVFMTGYKTTNTVVPSAVPLVVQLGGVDMTLVFESNATNVGDWGAIYYLDAVAAGSPSLAISGVSWRSLVAQVVVGTGHNAGSAIVASGGPRSSGNLSSQSFSRTTAAANATLVSALIIRALTGQTPSTIAGEVSSTGASTFYAAAATGGNVSVDHIFAMAHETVAVAGTDGHGYTWTTACRPDTLWVEVASATGGPTYSLSAQVGVFALVGNNANLIYSGDPTYRLTAVAASFVLSGKNATLTWSGGGVTQPLAITAMPFDGYVFDSADGSNAVVTIKGVGTTGDSIQVCGESGGGNTSYSAGATVDGAGNWTATLTVPLAQWGNWYTPAARIGTNDATKVTSSNTFGCGHVFGVLGQSQLEHALNTTALYSAVTMPSLLAQNVTMLTQQAGSGIVKRRITSATVGQVNVAMVSVANALAYSRPGRKFMIADMAEPGTGRAQLQDDANIGRNWSDLQAMIDLVRSGGSDFGAIVECWHGNDVTSLDRYGLEWAPLYFGQRWGGGAFVLHTTNPDSTINPGSVVDHCFWDIEAAAGALGRGVFARSRTKLYMLGPPPFGDAATSVEQTNFSTGGGARIDDLDRPARDTLAAFAADSRVQSFCVGYGVSQHVADYGGDVHPVLDSRWGVVQTGLNLLPAILTHSGTLIGEPVIVGTETASDGSYADIIVDLPNGGNLTTIRVLNSIAAPGTEPPHFQPVVGVEIRRVADSDAARRPVFKTSETTYPVNYRGTVTIADAGTGTPPSRRGRIRVTPTTPFVAGDRLEFLRGECTGYLLEPRDVNAVLSLDMPIEHVPALYDAAATYPYQGVPVRPQPALMTLSMPTYRLTAQVGSFALSGKTAVLSMNRRLLATAASFVLTGHAATLTYVPGGLAPPVGSFGDRPITGKIIGGSFG